MFGKTEKEREEMRQAKLDEQNKALETALNAHLTRITGIIESAEQKLQEKGRDLSGAEIKVDFAHAEEMYQKEVDTFNQQLHADLTGIVDSSKNREKVENALASLQNVFGRIKNAAFQQLHAETEKKIAEVKSDIDRIIAENEALGDKALPEDKLKLPKVPELPEMQGGYMDMEDITSGALEDKDAVRNLVKSLDGLSDKARGGVLREVGNWIAKQTSAFAGWCKNHWPKKAEKVESSQVELQEELAALKAQLAAAQGHRPPPPPPKQDAIQDVKRGLNDLIQRNRDDKDDSPKPGN
ncbi:MAG: hypothetical protein P1U61_01760 [Legionellaceae bacterium]|nr:hypothetical protein [Legionellaceae bacterium]